eukprot:TRINITY_DN57346_c0_g1_i1.p1 TRINITY_DN57346_c0_g1~~TRINITY_DN57346_c0_g1_i1.p1  ORF type:complete len:746 (+),score=117.11 TRINITY_DN57346_c0_g1_i1:74-2311(+)
MRRWGRVLRKPADGVVDLPAADDLPVPIDLTVDEVPTASDSTIERPVELEVAPSTLRARACTDVSSQQSLPTSPTASCSQSDRPIPIHPHISTSFHAKLRAGLKESATAAPSLVQQVQQPSRLPTINRGDGSAQKRSACTLVWLRPFDLRLHDHPALWYAASRGCPVQVVFAWSDAEDAALGAWQLAGTAAAFWLHHAISSFSASLHRKYGLSVAIRTGDTVASAVLAAAQECSADEVVTSAAFEPAGPAGRESEAAAKNTLELAGIRFRSFNSFLLQDVSKIHVDMGTYRGHFGTLTPFHHACMSQPPVERPTAEPAALQRMDRAIGDEGLDALGFARMPVRRDGSVLDWGAPIQAAWDISEAAGLATLRQFLERGGGLDRYEKGRQLADASAVTRISPYLRFGMLSCRLMFYEMKAAGAKEKSIVYWRRLVWRDLAYWQLSLFPRMQHDPIRAHYVGQEWNQDQHALQCWQSGKTGYPIVDAGMRELWSTGWMAQNVRMLAAILLCEHLNMHWVQGERWFHHTLVDADAAINAMMWQNAGKSGLDQWNFSMNPATSGKNMDPTGKYVRKWCPELAKLPIKFLHTPWDAPEHVLQEAGVSLGRNYPRRIVADLQAAAKVSEDAIRNQRKRALDWSNDQGYDLIVLPRGSTLAHDGQKFRVFTVPKYRSAVRSADNVDGGEIRSRPAKGQRKGKNKGKGGGMGFDARASTRPGDTAGSEPYFSSSAAAKSSHQSVLYEYMKASGG